MPDVRFRKEHFQGKTPMEPGWYLLDVGDATEKPSKEGDSQNFWLELTVDGAGDEKSVQFAGTKLRHCFNEKAIEYAGGAAEYMACFTTDVDKLDNMKVIEALQATTGKKVLGYVEWDPQFTRNSVKNWRPANQ